MPQIVKVSQNGLVTVEWNTRMAIPNDLSLLTKPSGEGLPPPIELNALPIDIDSEQEDLEIASYSVTSFSGTTMTV